MNLPPFKTRRDPPPIPDRQFDWSAWVDGCDEPGYPIGYGATELDAIQDLTEKLEDE